MIKGLLFDLNGTVIDILTDEGYDDLYRVSANFLDYYGVKIAPGVLRRQFFELNRQQRHNSSEKYPEFDVSKIFQEIIQTFQTRTIADTETLADTAATVFRAASRFRLECYDGVNEILNELQNSYKMGASTDGQSLWAKPELFSVGLEKFFDPVLISGDFGYRKPDKRLFAQALKMMELAAGEVLFVGNDMYRDVYGGHHAGMKTVFYKSNQGDHQFRGAEPDYIISSFRELPQAIEFLNAQSTK